MIILLSKFLLALISVVVLAEISKRVNPVLGGLLSGLPLGTGLSVYYITADNGVDFVLKGIPWGIAALTSSILFCLTYLLIGKIKIKALLGIIISSTISISVFVLWGKVLSSLSFTLFTSIIIFLLFFILNILVIKKLYVLRQNFRKSKNGKYTVVIRGVIAGAVILILTTIGSKAGSNWAGILSSFPSTLFALIIVLHYEEGHDLYPSILKGFSYGISTLVVFYIGCNITFPLLGLNTGFIITFIICLTYLFLMNTFKQLLYKIIKK